jgi:hypothetical protein
MTQESTPRPSPSLRATVSGDGLPPEVLQRVEQAVQRTVLQELLNLNLGPGYRVSLALEADRSGGGGTQGIWVQGDF